MLHKQTKYDTVPQKQTIPAPCTSVLLGAIGVLGESADHGEKDTAVAGAGGRTRSRNGRGSRGWWRRPPAFAAATVTATVAVTTTATAVTVAAVTTVPTLRAVCQSRDGRYGWLSGRVDPSRICGCDDRAELGRCGGATCGSPFGGFFGSDGRTSAPGAVAGADARAGAAAGAAGYL